MLKNQEAKLTVNSLPSATHSLDQPLTSANPVALEPYLVSQAINDKVRPVEVGKRKSNNPLARWEVGLTVAPWLVRPSTFGQTYTETNNGGTPRDFSFDGRDLQLYSVRGFNLQLPRRVVLHSLNLRAARQFSNGLRVGAGLDWVPNSYWRINDPDDFPVDRLPTGDWANYSTWNSRSLNAVVTVDYTFLRRRRLRPYLGFLVLTPVSTKSEFRNHLLERSSGRSEVINRVASVNTFDFSYRWIQFRGGAHYSLNNRLSIGLEVMPDLGFNARWSL